MVSLIVKFYINLSVNQTSTYDHRVWRTGLPVRSAVLKPHAGRLVVGWVTTSESLLLYVFMFLFFFAYLSYITEVGRCLAHQPSVSYSPPERIQYVLALLWMQIIVIRPRQWYEETLLWFHFPHLRSLWTRWLHSLNNADVVNVHRFQDVLLCVLLPGGRHKWPWQILSKHNRYLLTNQTFERREQRFLAGVAYQTLSTNRHAR